MANTNTSTQQGTKKGGVITTATNMVFLNNIATQIYNQLRTNFSTLGANPDAYRTVLGIIATETGRNISVKSIKKPGPTVSKIGGTGSVYWNHTVIKSARASLGDGNVNLLQGLQAHSLMGVMGWNNVRGLDDKFPYILKEYKNLADGNGLIINAGEDIDAIYTSDLDGAERAIIAGLMVLESKYKTFLNNKLSPQRALVAATRAYLGIGKDQTGTTVNKYLATVTSLGLKISTSVVNYRTTNKSNNSLSTNPTSTIQTNTSARYGQPNIIDIAGQGNYIPPGTTNANNLSPDLIKSAGLEPGFIATVPSMPANIGTNPLLPVPGVINVASPSSPVNGATADAGGILSTATTIVNKVLTFSKPVLNYAGIPTYGLGQVNPKAPISFLNPESTLKSVAGVILPAGTLKPVGPLPDNPIVNSLTGGVTYGGTIFNDPITLIAAQQMPVGVIDTKSSTDGVAGATSNATPVPPPGC